MAEKETDGPSLEMPSLGFGRRRRKRRPEPEDQVETPPATEPEQEPTPEPEPEPTPEPEPQPTPEPEQTQQTQQTQPIEPAPVPPPTTQTEEPAPARKKRREFALPAIGVIPATLVTGLLVGVLTVGLIWLLLRVCELVRGTSSCGNPGFVLLVAAMVLTGWVGKRLLQAFHVSDAGSTSFLGIGLVAVVTLLFLGDHLFAWWIILAVPLLATVSYVIARAVTTAQVGPIEDNMHR